MTIFVNSQSIQRWAGTMDARSRLPHVVRQLVWGTIDRSDLRRVDFPAYESSQRPGFDGEVICDKGNAWVPEGRSVWELSVEQQSKSKADRDLKKRTDSTPPEERLSTTYVCLTARRFQDKKEWEAEQNKLGEWKEVKAYDADDLEQWMELAPGVASWFATEIGDRPEGVDDIAGRWDGIATATTCPLRPSLFLVGRERSTNRLQTWLRGEASELLFESRSPVEVLDFVCASLKALPDAEKVAVISRAVIVGSLGAWRQLRTNIVPAILIVDPLVELSAEEVGRAITRGHHVLRAVEPRSLRGDGESRLERAGEFALTQELEKCGYSPIEAERNARACGGSLAILKRRLAKYRSQYSPGWDQIAAPQTIASCLLLGGWEGGNLADQQVIETIAGRPYAELEAEFQRLSTCIEPMLFHAAGNWRLISKEDAWSTLGDRVTPSNLATWTTLAAAILADDDPKFSLPDDERWLAQLKGQIPKYSQTLKSHVAQTVAFLGAFGEKLDSAVAINVKGAVDRVVSDVLIPTASWHRWATLSSRLPLLAEASPRVFLRAVQEDLSRAESEVMKLFRDSGNVLFSGCNHAGLLWALETLAWSSELLAETCRILLRLAKLDPGGQWGNRPSGSLCEILSYWIPYTTAGLEERISLLDLLIADDREAAWPILLHLLPQPAGGVSMPTRSPMWRDWGDSWTRGVTRGESFKFTTAVGERVLHQAGQDAARWKQVFDNLSRLPHSVHAQLLEASAALAKLDFSDNERRILADELSEQINRHRYFQDANWSLPAETLDALEKTLDTFKPKSPVLRHAWLFEQWPDRFYERAGGDIEQHDRALEKARDEALQEIVRDSGFDGVLSLVANSGAPFIVGCTLATVVGDQFLAKILPAQITSSDASRGFASGFIWGRFRSNGWTWADAAFIRCMTDDERAWFLVTLSFDIETWNRADEAGDVVRALYWQRCRAWNHELAPNALERAVVSLTRYERPGDAIHMVAMAIHGKKEIASEFLLRPLQALIQLEGSGVSEQLRRADAYQIGEVIEALQDRTDIEESQLIQLEWNYLGLLDGHRGHSPKALHRKLAAKPEFFIELMSLCYPSPNERNESPEETAEVSVVVHRAHMIAQAFRLLHDWELFPGTSADGSIDEAALRTWCDEARRLAKECGRLDISDDYIGQLFAHSPQDKDGKWPCEAVRRVVQTIATKPLSDGLHCGICNSRGVVCRGDGGDQERELVAKFRARAKAIQSDSPFVADVLLSVAESYDYEAKRWDERDRWEK